MLADSMKFQASDEFNVSHIEPATHIYGPGTRFTLWVQGCSLGCKGCWNEEMWPKRPRTLIHRVELLQQILRAPNIDGITILGGEPLQQAENTLWLLAEIRKHSNLSIMTYTGYEPHELKQMGYWKPLLKFADIIVAGRYQEDKRNTYLRWRGSDNQQVIYPENSRLAQYPDESNDLEIIISEHGAITALGYPEQQ